MKQFNLEKALEGAEVFTRDGKSVTIGALNPEADSVYKLSGWIGAKGNFWTDEGRYMNSTESPDDLFMGDYSYINIHKDSIGMWADEKIYDSIEQATEHGILSETYYTTSRIEISK